ncbi:hypothetical protein HY637_01755 [Candidatus Woesearchaeota archaeon]|nr:hypothetical protein [Candidatus Woesearchaeota archaeon]
MSFHILSIVLAGILSFSDYVTEHIFSKKLRTNQKIVSFSAGVAIAYIILHLFPEISSNALISGRKLFLFALLGFVSLNLIEQYVYKSMGRMRNMTSYHKTLHVAYFFVYNFLIGTVLVIFAAKGLKQTLLFFVPFLLYIIAEILPQEIKFKSSISKVAYSMAPVAGAIAGIYLIDFFASVFGLTISFMTGTLLYIVIRESLPSDKAEKPFYFIAGVLFYTLIIYLSWSI